jgi:hypothetical protein
LVQSPGSSDIWGAYEHDAVAKRGVLARGHLASQGNDVGGHRSIAAATDNLMIDTEIKLRTHLFAHLSGSTFQVASPLLLGLTLRDAPSSHQLTRCGQEYNKAEPQSFTVATMFLQLTMTTNSEYAKRTVVCNYHRSISTFPGE